MNFRIPRVSLHKALLISALYISQSVPVSFIKTGFQTYLKNQDIAYDSISKLLGLILLPWALKFLWAPLVDRYGSSRFGHRKSWLIPLQLGGAVVLGVIAFMDIESQLNQIVLLFFFYSFLCATQDIAVDGLAVLSLSKKQHGLGNSMQMGGYYLGELLGGAVILIVLDQFGWTTSILTLAAFYLIPLFFLLPYKESKPPTPSAPATYRMEEIKSYFKGEQGIWILLLVLYMGNQVLARTLLPSLLKERHFTDTEVGFTIGVFGNSASIIC
ncbi:MAG: MFS transporter, partial [Bacteroidia bacterium]